MLNKTSSVPVPNKGEMLGRIFDHLDNLNLSAKKIKLFVDNNMTIADLTKLKSVNINDFNRWYKYNRRFERLMHFSTYTVLNS